MLALLSQQLNLRTLLFKPTGDHPLMLRLGAQGLAASLNPLSVLVDLTMRLHDASIPSPEGACCSVVCSALSRLTQLTALTTSYGIVDQCSTVRYP